MRELALLHLLYDTGVRSREVYNIRLTDFDKVHCLLTLRNSKGGKTLTVPYSLELREALRAYFKSLKSYLIVYLFENRDEAGRAITVRGVQYLVKEVVKRSRLRRDIHLHTFRHSFAIHYINNGGSLLRLKEFLGHYRDNASLFGVLLNSSEGLSESLVSDVEL